MKSKSIISMRDFSKEEILTILDETKKIKAAPKKDALKGKIMASCFFEPSTRTRLSFESAMKKLGGDVIGFAESASTSVAKKETLYDTMKVMSQYADLIVLRHPLEGAARLAQESASCPVINAGDGSNQHPTQTLLDLFTIRECQNRLDDLHIAFAGDLKYGRTVHSLVQAVTHFNMRLYFIAPSGLELPKQLCDELKRKSVLFSFHQSLTEILPKLDILYMTRIQKERMDASAIFKSENYNINASMLASAKPTLKILHPLPRIQEISRDVDETPNAHFFEQSQNGLYLRQALLTMILSGDRS